VPFTIKGSKRIESPEPPAQTKWGIGYTTVQRFCARLRILEHGLRTNL
jgi:hypothetical protein